MTDPTPSEILANMVAESGPDAVGAWRVRVPTSRPRSFAENVEITRQALAAIRATQGQRKDLVALANLVTAALVRHESGQCICLATSAVVRVDPVCESAMELVREMAASAQ